VAYLTKGHFFYIPAKFNMDVYKDARSLISDGIMMKREINKTNGAGKNTITVTLLPKKAKQA
jgi:hypothetical protein